MFGKRVSTSTFACLGVPMPYQNRSQLGHVMSIIHGDGGVSDTAGLYSERSCVSPSQLIAELVDQHGHKLPMGGQEARNNASSSESSKI